MSTDGSLALAPGSRIGAYEILAPLKSGGMATLFVGRRLGPAGFVRPVAIKVVHPHLASDRSFVEMFLDEARLSARIQHPNVVHVEELGEQNGVFYLAMEYVHGCSLSQFLRQLALGGRGMSPEIACAIAMKVADGLHAAHETADASGQLLGVVHRDISPQNVLLSYDGHVKLIDFGVAKARGRSQETDGVSMKGKLRYMAPEQAWGQPVDRRTDVYALGIVLWESLTHKRLFGASDDFVALEQVRAPMIPAPSRLAPGVAPALDEAMLTALARDPEARFQTAQAFRRAIGNACPGAMQVAAEDVSAVLLETMREEIERQRATAPPTLSPALAVPKQPPERRTDAMRVYTTQLPSAPVDPVAMERLSHGAAAVGSLATLPASDGGPGREAFTSARSMERAHGAETGTPSTSTTPTPTPISPTPAAPRGSLTMAALLGAALTTAALASLWAWNESHHAPPRAETTTVSAPPSSVSVRTVPATTVAPIAVGSAPIEVDAAVAPGLDVPEPPHGDHRRHPRGPAGPVETPPPPSSGADHVPFVTAPTF